MPTPGNKSGSGPVPTPVTSLYRRDEAIGRGNFGVVYRGTNLQTKQVVAIKVLNLDTVEDEVKDVQHEITMLSQLSQSDGANITKYYGSYLHGTRLWIIMDFCAGGSVRLLLKAGVIEERYTAVIMRELLHALVYIHREGVIHRDIKAANILITKEGRVRLCDFGVAAKVSSSKVKRSTIVGTPYWMAPEVITEGALYNAKADVWSLGITVFEMTTGNPPYSDQEAFRAIMLIPKQKPARLEGPQYSAALKEFVANCLDEHPNERPSAEDLIKLKLIRNTKNVPTTMLRDLIVRYRQWKDQHGSNVRDSVVVFNQNKPLDFEDEEAELESNTDTLWDFELDPSNNNLPMPPRFEGSAMSGGSLGSTSNGHDSIGSTGFSGSGSGSVKFDTGESSDGNRSLSGVNSEGNSRGGTIVGSMATTMHNSIGKLSEAEELNASSPSSQNLGLGIPYHAFPSAGGLDANGSVATAPISQQQNTQVPVSMTGYSPTARLTSPLEEAPQSLMELFGVTPNQESSFPNIAMSAPHLPEAMTSMPSLPSSANAGQSTPTVEIEIPTFESLSAAATNGPVTSHSNTNKPVPPIPTSSHGAGHGGLQQLSPKQSQTQPQGSVQPSNTSPLQPSTRPLPHQSQSHSNLPHVHISHPQPRRPSINTNGLPSSSSQPASAGTIASSTLPYLPSLAGHPNVGPGAPPSVPPPALPTKTGPSSKPKLSGNKNMTPTGPAASNASMNAPPTIAIPPVPPMPSINVGPNASSPPLGSSSQSNVISEAGLNSVKRSISPRRHVFKAPSLASPPVSPQKDTFESEREASQESAREKENGQLIGLETSKDISRDASSRDRADQKASTPLVARSRNNSSAGTMPPSLDVSVLSNTPSPISSPSTIPSQTFSRNNATGLSTPRNLSQRKLGGKMRIALPISSLPQKYHQQVMVTNSGRVIRQFPPLPQLDLSILLDTTPKEAVISQLDALLDVFMSGLDQVKMSLDKVPV